MTEIKFSRHAKRRLALYEITEKMISSLIEDHLKVSSLKDGRHEVVGKKTDRRDYPLKAVFFLDKNEITVITAYPLKKGLKK
jgi:hypothetical protein